MDKEDVVHTYNRIHSAIKQNEIMPSVATWMDLEVIILNQVKKRKKYYLISLVCGL